MTISDSTSSRKPLHEIKPYGEEGTAKKEEVVRMFNTIASRYDFLNHLLSMGIDKGWRKKAISLLASENPNRLLDVATGTGEFAMTALKLNPEKITGIDIAEGMLEIGRKKIANKGLSGKIELLYGDSENIPFADNTFDAATVAFGVRNFENLDKGLKEINRVLRPGGTLVVLEFSRPRSFPVKQFYNFYFNRILPFIGRMVSGDKSAYSYLPESVNAFPDGKMFLQRLEQAGFGSLKEIRLTFGVASIYTARAE